MFAHEQEGLKIDFRWLVIDTYTGICQRIFEAQRNTRLQRTSTQILKILGEHDRTSEDTTCVP